MSHLKRITTHFCKVTNICIIIYASVNYAFRESNTFISTTKKRFMQYHFTEYKHVIWKP